MGRDWLAPGRLWHVQQREGFCSRRRVDISPGHRFSIRHPGLFSGEGGRPLISGGGPGRHRFFGVGYPPLERVWCFGGNPPLFVWCGVFSTKMFGFPLEGYCKGVLPNLAWPPTSCRGKCWGESFFPPQGLGGCVPRSPGGVFGVPLLFRGSPIDACF